jgi:protein-S-isoprenylcysteine O-methyltransferase Ste14
MQDAETDRLIEQANAVLNETAASGSAGSSWWTPNNAMTMCVLLLVFAMMVMGLTAWLLKAGHSASALLRVFGTILVIVMATFLVVAGYTNEQLGAPLGLLGTIAGYLLGRDSATPKVASSD